MARAALLGRLNWTLGEVVELIDETPRVRSIFLDVPDWPGHRPGQHVDIRLTAEDGYQAQRSYSIASAPEVIRPMMTVERLPDGEVSTYLVDELLPGDQIELRGPIGGHFVWEASLGGPLFLAAGGFGIVPFMSMLRHRAATESRVPARLVYSSRAWEDTIFRDELTGLAARGDGLEVIHTLTRSQPDGWKGYTRRLDAALLADIAWPPTSKPLTYVCGPTPFVETVANALVLLGHDARRVKTERFGPTGR